MIYQKTTDSSSQKRNPQANLEVSVATQSDTDAFFFSFLVNLEMCITINSFTAAALLLLFFF